MNEYDKLLFSIISWGHTATTWLSKVLNAHPEVFAVHNLRNPLPVLNNLGFHKSLINDLITILPVFDKTKMLVNTVIYYEYLDSIAKTYKLAGEVHGTRFNHIPILRRHFGDRIRIASITRHPIPRILSNLALIRLKGDNAWKTRNINFKGIKKSLPPNLQNMLNTKEELFIVSTISNVNRIKRDFVETPVFKMESITSDFDEFNRLFSHLSQDTLTMKWEMVESIFNTRVASKNVNKVSDDPGELFNAMEDWQREAFVTLFDPRAREIYEELGYDFSFMD